MKHVGSAHDETDLAALKLRAQQLLDGNQGTLDLGIDTTPAGTGSGSSPVPITSERAGHLINAIHDAYAELGFDQATDGDQVFKNLVTARIVQPGSKFDSIETLAEIGVTSASYPTIKRHLPTYATTAFRDNVTAACATHAGIGPGVLVLYDVTTLYFETDEGDDFRKPGFLCCLGCFLTVGLTTFWTRSLTSFWTRCLSSSWTGCLTTCWTATVHGVSYGSFLLDA